MNEGGMLVFILDPEKIVSFNVDEAAVFIKCWARFYNYDVKNFGTLVSIDYLRELNLGNELSAENVTRLLRWKDPRMLSKVIQSGTNKGKINPRVKRVIDQIHNINSFRFREISENDFNGVT